MLFVFDPRLSAAILSQHCSTSLATWLSPLSPPRFFKKRAPLFRWSLLLKQVAQCAMAFNPQYLEGVRAALEAIDDCGEDTTSMLAGSTVTEAQIWGS